MSEQSSTQMPKSKRNRSIILDRAQSRAAAIATIAETVELGGELTLAAYTASITEAQTKLNAYNTKLTDADTFRREFERIERNLADLSDRMLAGVGAVYGKNSDAYAKAGGVKKSERKRPSRSTATTTEVADAA
jgi:uncharacterized protein YciW